MSSTTQGGITIHVGITDETTGITPSHTGITRYTGISGSSSSALDLAQWGDGTQAQWGDGTQAAWGT